MYSGSVELLYSGSVELKPPVLFAVGCVFLFTVEGLTGVVLADSGVDLAVLWHE